MTSTQISPKLSIVGGGIAGLASALALATSLPSSRITVFELRQTPSTIGGTINVTPNALRYLDQLGVLSTIKNKRYGADLDGIEIFSHASGAKLATVDFANATGGDGIGFGNPPYKALRIRRADLLDALIVTVAERENIEILFGKKAVGVDENPEAVTVRFGDGTSSSADCLLGCDGIHSAIRAFVEPARKPVYTGIAVANGFATLDDVPSLSWKSTGLVSSRLGNLVASYYEASRKEQFVAAVIETPEVKSKEGWRAKGSDQETVKADVRRRFGGAPQVPGLDALIESTEDWDLYPVYKLPPRGQWATPRVLLLGDAAHAMPPQGESVGMALEDVMTFAKLASVHQSHTWLKIFMAYESLRRDRIDAAYKWTSFRWDSAKDCGWVKQSMKEWMTGFFTWWSSKSRRCSFEEDVGDFDLATVFVGGLEEGKGS